MIKNANSLPKRYYGLHFSEGVAEYKDGETSYRILLKNETIKNMGPTFEGRPVYVGHVDRVNLDRLQTEVDGYVVKSFYNAGDGFHWVEFMVVSDDGHEAIKKGWKLSNAYNPKRLINGGLWHGVQYAKEIIEGEYEHLAIVPNPRYSESIILTPEQFAEYNEKKQAELKKLSNSKENKNMFELFKKTKVENAGDIESFIVVLPKCKKEKTYAQLVNDSEALEEKKSDDMADLSHKVKLHDDSTCNVGELLEKHKALHDTHQALSAEHEELKKKYDAIKGDDDSDDGKLKPEEKKPEELAAEKKNMEKDKEVIEKAKEIEEHEEEEIAMAKKNSRDPKFFEELKNAPDKVKYNKTDVLNLSQDQVARGKQRYGSNK
jgi:Uncharacterized protein conserved in bacteria (DUF2213)